MKDLIKFVDSINVAADIPKEKLQSIADRVIRQFNEDDDSMMEWKKLNDEGLKLSTPDLAPRSSPWQGSANYKHTGIQQACISFGDRASAELLKDADLMLTDFIGKEEVQEEPEQPPQQAPGMPGQEQAQQAPQEKPKRPKAERAERISEYENYQINYLMDDFRDQQSKLMYGLAAYGSLFKKVWYDPIEDKKMSSIIHYPNYAVSQGSTTLNDARSFTEIHTYSINQALEYKNAGYWLDVDLSQKSEDMQEGSNASEDANKNSDNPNNYYEQNTYLDLDGDGYEEPYIVTVHVSSNKVVRIVADYTLDDIVVKNGNVISTLGEASRINASALEEACKGTLIKVNRSMNIVKYGFIRAIDGTFLDIGYFWLLAAITQLANTTTNQLIDAGTLAIRKGGFLSREFRKGDGMSGGTTFKTGEWKQTDIPAVNMANGVMPLPQSDPSPVLLQLNQDTKMEIAQFTSSIDLQGIISGNTPATTALVAVQEQIVPISAIYQYIQRSMSKEFEMLKNLTPGNCTEESYQSVVGKDYTIEADYNKDVMVMATAQKQMSNKIVNMYEAEGMMAQMPAVQQAGGNPIPIIKNYFEQFASINMDDVFPEMSDEEEAAQVEKMNIQAQKEAQLLDLQIAKETSAVEAFKAEQQAFNMKEQGNMAMLQEEIVKLRSESAVNNARMHDLLASAIERMANADRTKLDGAVNAMATVAEGIKGVEVEVIESDDSE